MRVKRFFGLGLLVIAVAAALALDHVGRDHEPRSYRLDFVRSTQLAEPAERRIEQIAAVMARQPAYRAIITGHTGTRGDPDANQKLGRQRAERVAQSLEDEGIEAERLEMHSAGASEPLPQRDDESDRRYQARLSRVQIDLRP